MAGRRDGFLVEREQGPGPCLSKGLNANAKAPVNFES